MELMKNYSIFELPRKYENMQKQLCKELSQEFHQEIKPSDVVFLAYSNQPIKDYERGSGSRFCLTPGLDKISGGPYSTKKD